MQNEKVTMTVQNADTSSQFSLPHDQVGSVALKVVRDHAVETTGIAFSSDIYNYKTLKERRNFSRMLYTLKLLLSTIINCFLPIY